VEIVARSTPDTVWGSDFQNVADFALLDDQLLLLVYQSEQRWKRQEEKDKTLYRNAQLVLLGKQGEELNRLSVPGEAIQLHLACTDDVFLEGRSAFYHVMVDDNNLRLESMDYEVYRNQLEPVIDTLGNLTIFSTYNEAYPAFEYMTFNRVDSSMHTLRCIINEEVMETFRSEYKYLPPRQKLEAFRYQVKTGIDKEIVAAYMTGFQNSAYYEPVNAPLFVMNDTLLIFDHHHDQLLRMDKDGETIDSVMIGYHHSVRPEKWSGRLLSDKETKEIYTVYDRSGKNVLKKINVHSGEATSSFELTYRYADKLQVVNGWAYYIWRPFESAQHRFLYKEKL